MTRFDALVDFDITDVQFAYNAYKKDVPFLAIELWKFIQLYEELQFSQQVYFFRGTLLNDFDHIVGNYIAITSDHTVHDSFLVIRDDQREFLKKVIEYLIDGSIRNMDHLERQPFLFSKWLYDATKDDSNWIHVPVICEGLFQEEETAFDCPSYTRLCCLVMNAPSIEKVTGKSYFDRALVLTNISRYDLTPTIAQDLNDNRDKDLPYITTVTESKVTNDTIVHFKAPETLNFCLPVDENCASCLESHDYGRCSVCMPLCDCFCREVCNTTTINQVKEKLVFYSLPKYVRDQKRFIPRIVHQTWHEPVSNKDKYPNFSRTSESWRQTKWDYRFWTEKDASRFIDMNFPQEVKEAYETYTHNSFRLDLFRYCVLFIYGGVFADIDVMSESLLESAIDIDVGFMIPVDIASTGIEGHSFCLWNGFIASAAGHPFLARIIQDVVNNIRNRYSTVDHIQNLCSEQGDEIDYTVAFGKNTSFFSGSCAIGVSINKVLRRVPQSYFSYIEEIDAGLETFGRFVVLKSNQFDMGSHLITHWAKNLIVASIATDGYNYPEQSPRYVYSSAKKQSQLPESSDVYKSSEVHSELLTLVERI